MIVLLTLLFRLLTLMTLCLRLRLFC